MKRKGMTLIELLVVIAIIGILIGMLLPAVQAVREAARRMTCQSQLKQLALAAQNYESSHGRLPSGAINFWQGRYVGIPWPVQLLPYIEQDNLHAQWDMNTPINNTLVNGAPANGARTATYLKLLVCPTDTVPQQAFELTLNSTGQIPGWHAPTSYVSNLGTYGYWPEDPNAKIDGMMFLTGPESRPFKGQQAVRLAEVTDGLSNTFLFGERYHHDPVFNQLPCRGYDLEHWSAWGWSSGEKGVAHWGGSTRVPLNYKTSETTPCELNRDLRVSGFGSGHKGGANFAFGDGSVRFISDSIDQATYRGYSTRAGGEILSGN